MLALFIVHIAPDISKTNRINLSELDNKFIQPDTRRVHQAIWVQQTRMSQAKPSLYHKKCKKKITHVKLTTDDRQKKEIQGKAEYA